jgi:hypothetical protein
MNAKRRHVSLNPHSDQSRTIPAWQVERANRLHRKFKRCESAMQRGKSLNSCFRYFAWYWSGEHYRSDPSKLVRFSRGSLRRLFYQWRKHGCTPECLYLRFSAGRRALSVSALLAFVEFCTANQFPSLQLALKGFRKTHAGPLAHFSYRSVYRYFPGYRFRRIQAALRAGDRDYKRASDFGRQAQARILEFRKHG